MSGFQVVRLDELGRIPVDNGLEWRPIRRRLGIRAFGMNAYTSTAVGDWVVEEHTESSGHEEAYVVVAGRARFTIGDETVDAPAGTIVFISDSTLNRVAVSEEEGTTVIAVGGWPDRAFEPSPWEWWFEAYAQPPAEAAATMKDAIRQFGARPALYYHLACVEARAGNADDARRHLARAVQLDPQLAERAADDEDLQGL